MKQDSITVSLDPVTETRADRALSIADALFVALWALLFRQIAAASFTHATPLFLSFTILSAGVFCIALRQTLIPWMLASVVLSAAGIWRGLEPWNVLCLSVSLPAIAVLGWHAVRGNRQAQPLLRMAVGLPAFVALSIYVHAAIVLLTPRVYDGDLMKLDLGIGQAVWHWAALRPPMFAFASLTYGTLPIAVSLGLAYLPPAVRNHLLRASALAALLAMPCYVLLPAMGPVHFARVQPLAARNCMPSLHLSWALILWFNVSRKWWKRCALCFVGLTAFATLATGEHYAIDLIAAVPFSYLVQYLSASRTAHAQHKSVPAFPS